MSHYDCVLPVDFERLSREIMPAWLDFIAGKREPRAFAHEFAPWQIGVGDLEFWPEDNWQEPFDLPLTYIEWFRNHEMTEWKTETIRAELGKLITDKSMPWCASDLLMLAIKQSSAVEISGVDDFEPSGIIPFTNLHFYGRLHEPPFVQVVGTKNHFWFLNELFESQWETPCFSSRISKQVVSSEVDSLLKRLFFSVRAFPGTPLIKKDSILPHGDDCALTGFLSPDETQSLFDKIHEIEIVLAYLKDDEDKTWPFNLFVDRLKRAASSGAGLVTLFSGL